MLIWGRRLIGLLNIMNWVLGLIYIGIALLVTLNSSSVIARLATAYPHDPAAISDWIKVGGLAMVFIIPAVHIIFRRLIAMIDSVAECRAFESANAQRLRVMAWALLVINFADLGFGLTSAWASKASGAYLGWAPTMTGWLAVLFLFILARIFEEGAAMKAELDDVV